MDAETVADDILKIAKRRGLKLKPIQLVKLTYIAYGWYLAIHDKRLFDDRIEAWKYGPVIPSLYRATKHFGRNDIPHSLIADSPISDPDNETFLDSIVELYGHFPGIALSNLTHRPGTPWRKVYQPDTLGIQIPDDLIKAHYLEALNEQ